MSLLYSNKNEKKKCYNFFFVYSQIGTISSSWYDKMNHNKPNRITLTIAPITIHIVPLDNISSSMLPWPILPAILKIHYTDVYQSTL